MAATKGRSINQIRELVNAGISIIGENRVQELIQKLLNLPKGLRTDFIGHLQSNKVKEVVNNCGIIHSVDSIKLAQIINTEAERVGKIQKILLEVNMGGESSKHGFSPQDVKKAVGEIIRLKNLSLQGLMTMAPHFPDPEQTRPIFSTLRELRDKLEVAFHISLPDLSMGMSNDFSIAIEEGATIIRLGRILFE